MKAVMIGFTIGFTLAVMGHDATEWRWWLGAVVFNTLIYI